MRTISIILIFLMIFSCFGCYNTLLVKQEDEIRNILEQKKGIYNLTTQSSERYSFYNHQYKYVFKNDTLYGSAKRFTSDPWQKFESIQFPVSEISNIEIQEMDVLRSGIFVMAAGFVVYEIIINFQIGFGGISSGQ